MRRHLEATSSDVAQRVHMVDGSVVVVVVVVVAGGLRGGGFVFAFDLAELVVVVEGVDVVVEGADDPGEVEGGARVFVAGVGFVSIGGAHVIIVIIIMMERVAVVPVSRGCGRLVRRVVVGRGERDEESVCAERFEGLVTLVAVVVRVVLGFEGGCDCVRGGLAGGGLDRGGCHEGGLCALRRRGRRRGLLDPLSRCTRARPPGRTRSCGRGGHKRHGLALQRLFERCVVARGRVVWFAARRRVDALFQELELLPELADLLPRAQQAAVHVRLRRVLYDARERFLVTVVACAAPSARIGGAVGDGGGGAAAATRLFVLVLLARSAHRRLAWTLCLRATEKGEFPTPPSKKKKKEKNLELFRARARARAPGARWRVFFGKTSPRQEMVRL